ncbi:MAG TPA: MFS transporter [Polyangiaceae bacterium]|jgi:AAA family ATP:ADP antiporter
MGGRSSWLPGFVDVRRDEIRALVTVFAVLFLLITAHTVLETARDALVLTRLPSRALGVVYVAVAVCALPAAALAAHATERFGVRQALVGGLLTGAVLLVALFVVPSRRTSAVAVYVTSALVGAVLVPQFWSLLGSIFNVAQARRLLGIVGAAGVMGGAAGSATAAALLLVLHVKMLLLVSSGLLLVTACVLVGMHVDDRSARPQPLEALPSRKATAALREEPFLQRIALLVVATTAAGLVLDYFFKWTIARTVPHEHIAGLVATYYAWLNGVSLVAQLFVTGALVRRVGVATTLVVTPALLLLGGVGALVAGGALAVVLGLRGIDGTLRNSVNRATTELVYLPVPQRVRARAKPFIDGALARVTQAVAGAVLLALGSANYLSSALLAGIVVAAIAVWLAVAVTTRGPYLAVLRHAVAGDALLAQPELDPIDVESAGTLVEYLASEDTGVVVGAMNALARRGREQLIPALVLLHESDAVVIRALAIFGASAREDWVPRARRLLTRPDESVRTAAARALALHGRLDAADLPTEAGPRLHAYAALHLVLARPDADPADDAHVAQLLELPGEEGDEARLGLLAVVADAKPDARLSRLLQVLEMSAKGTREWTEGLAAASASQHAESMIPDLIARLVDRDGREVVRRALVALGTPAMDAVWAALRDTTRERRLRVHLPNTLARFGTRAAAEMLLECVETEREGFVRYKAIRALGRLTSDQRLTMDRLRVERLSYGNLVEYFRLLGLKAAFLSSSGGARTPDAAATERLLVGLLDDKLRQSLERTFRLLKIAHPRDDIRRVQAASLSEDGHTRANASEFLDALLRKRDQRALRELLLIVADDLAIDARVARAATITHGTAPATREAALASMIRDTDAVLAALASLHTATVAGKPWRVAIGGRPGERPPIELASSGTLPASVGAEEGRPDA